MTNAEMKAELRRLESGNRYYLENWLKPQGFYLETQSARQAVVKSIKDNTVVTTLMLWESFAGDIQWRFEEVGYAQAR